MSSRCLLLRSWPRCQVAPASPVRQSSPSPLVTICSAMCFYFYGHWPRLPAYLRSLLSLLPLLVLFSSWCAPFMLSWCPFGVARSWCLFGVARSQLVLFCPLGVFVVLLMSSFGFYVVLLPSCCLRWLSKAGAEFMAGNWLMPAMTGSRPLTMRNCDICAAAVSGSKCL